MRPSVFLGQSKPFFRRQNQKSRPTYNIFLWVFNEQTWVLAGSRIHHAPQWQTCQSKHKSNYFQTDTFWHKNKWRCILQFCINALCLKVEAINLSVIVLFFPIFQRRITTMTFGINIKRLDLANESFKVFNPGWVHGIFLVVSLAPTPMKKQIDPTFVHSSMEKAVLY